jgi:hypothetical protein
LHWLIEVERRVNFDEPKCLCAGRGIQWLQRAIDRRRAEIKDKTMRNKK